MLKESLEAIMTKMGELANSKTVVGEPIISNNKTIIPLLAVRMGFGSGGGEGNAPQQGVGHGEGGGGGLSVSPTALIIIDEAGVQVYSLAQKGSIAKLVEMIPEVMAKMPKNDGCGSCCC
jgi:uncharacterized spore protein YtfJ